MIAPCKAPYSLRRAELRSLAWRWGIGWRCQSIAYILRALLPDAAADEVVGKKRSIEEA